MSDQLQQLKAQAVGGNLKGTLAGAVAAIAVGLIAKGGYIAAISVAVGIPEADISLALVALIGGCVNYAVTHWSFGATLKAAYEALPQTYAEYPNDPKPPVSQGPANSNINKSGDGNHE